MPPNPVTALKLASSFSANVTGTLRHLADCINLIVSALTGRTTTPITILGDLTLNGATTTTDPINTSSYIDFTAIATPATPAANHARFYGEVVQGHTRLAFLDDDGIDMVVTRDNVFVVRNTSGSDMTKGQAVYVTGSTGNVPTVSLAKADSLTTLPAIGLLLQNTANNAFGMCMILGVLSSFDTSAWSTGDRLFVSATTAGAMTNARPVSPLYAQRIGSVLVDGVGNGSIDVTTAPFVGGEESGTTATTYYYPSGMVLDFATGDVTLTHASNTLTIAGGNLALASALTLTSGQISFPATQAASADANTLDDYEESTWTPTILINGTTITSYAFQAGTYTKIGNRVILHGSVRASTVGAGTGEVTIGGLPFTADATANNHCAVSVFADNLANLTTESMMGRILAGGTTIILYNFASGTATAMPQTKLQTNATFTVNVSYQV